MPLGPCILRVYSNITSVSSKSSRDLNWRVRMNSSETKGSMGWVLITLTDCLNFRGLGSQLRLRDRLKTDLYYNTSRDQVEFGPRSGRHQACGVSGAWLR